ncbi:FtsB family cell division protein [Limoniibacter endophyticus]|uniref:Cell division protein n=1 Tax=Limoniibacter endophyticus TaxID=1565040 RepID=A0A8J3DL58_9HYPH|nr:septum formation initiator family protein [Limoniibacter endophyticus]GHC63010.1 cell division protein [Limoniibacter endophyticus]
MWTKQHKNRPWGRLIVPSIATLFLSYFGFHAYNGEYGIYSKYQLIERRAGLEQQLAAIRAERMELDNRLSLLRDGTIERDMLDEQVRRVLNMSQPDELIILETGRIVN